MKLSFLTNEIVTFMGAGRVPKAPGTVGTLAAMPFGWLIAEYAGNTALCIAAIIAFLIGWWASDIYVQQTGREDPSEVVIDEVAAIWLVLSFMPQQLLFYILAFLAFRVFDIYKPWPVSWADERVKGGLGIMLDDILAGLYALPIPYLMIAGYTWITTFWF